MPCSYCLSIGHNITKCSKFYSQYTEEYLNTITFDEFLKKMFEYRYMPNTLKFKKFNISQNYKYLFDKYTNTTVIRDKNVFKLKIQIEIEERNSIDDSIFTNSNIETMFVKVPDNYNKKDIELYCLTVGYYIEDFESDCMSVTRYKILEANWCS